MNVFLDLEETIIDDWFSCNFLFQNIKNIEKMIKKFSISFDNKIATSENINLILFSAAVINQKDLDRFNNMIKPVIEEHLSFKFKSEFLFSNNNIKNLVENNGIKMLPNDHISDIFNLNVKEQIFKLISIENETNVLFDDTVIENSVETLFDDSFEDKKTIKICVKV